MEEVQKNENGTTVPQADGKPKKENKPKRELTPQQVQQRRKMIVFPLMFLAFAGCMYLIFAPSGKEDVNVESVGGFNADIPLPAEDGIIADKQKAYEQAVTSRKQQDKIQSLQDFGFTLDDDTEEPQEEINLLPEEDPKPQRGGGASSRAAYRDINRQLSTFYETPPVDEEKEELKRQVAELTDRLKQQQNATPTADDQMALLEKSYELAAKYMNGQDGQRGQIAQIPTAGQNGGGIGTPAIPVQAIRETTVSGLQQPMSDADFIRAYSQPRNYGFNTAVGTGYAMGKNTVAACIHQDQTLVDGQAVKLRLLEPMQAGRRIPLWRGRQRCRANGSTYWCPRLSTLATSSRWNSPCSTRTGKRGFPSRPLWSRKRSTKLWRISEAGWVQAFPLPKVPGSRWLWT